MSGSKTSSSSALVLGVIAAIAVGTGAALWYTQYSGSPEDKVVAKVQSIVADGDEEPAQTGEASEEGDQPNEDQVKSEAEAEAEEHKKQYDHAISMADKFMKGQRYMQAAEKYSEAIEILPKVPSAASNILPLYNNRSAMYEKSGPEYFDKALNDIALVLQLDAKHMKARVRRARILEQKGKMKESLIDYTVHFYMEQAKGMMPSSAQKVEDISKVIAYTQATQNLELQLKEAFEKSGGFQRFAKYNSRHIRDIPAKNFVRTTLENFPSICKWKVRYRNTDLQGLIERYNAICASSEDGVGDIDKIQLQMDLVCCAVAKESYKIAFNYLAKNPTNSDVDLTARADLLEVRSLLCGLEMYLRRNLLGAEDCWKGAMGALQKDRTPELAALCAEAQLNLGNNDAALALFNEAILDLILRRQNSPLTGNESRDIGSDDARTLTAEEKELPHTFPLFYAYLEGVPSSSASLKAMVEEVAQSISKEGLVNLAYALILRSNVWTARVAANNFKMRDDPISPAQADLDLAFAVADCVKENIDESSIVASPTATGTGDKDPEENADDLAFAMARHAKMQSLCKRIHLLASTKGLAGVMHTADDITKCKEYVEMGKAIDPNNKTLSLLAIDVMAMDEDFEQSVASMEEFIRTAEPGDGVPYVMKANILTHQGMSSAKNPTDQEATFAKLKEASDLYDKAIEVEPNCVEARAQACQLKCIIGDMEGAAQLAEQVVKLARSRDEALDLEHLLVQTSSQIAALKELYADNQN